MMRNGVMLLCVIVVMFLFIYFLRDTQTRYYELHLKRGEAGVRFFRLPDCSSIEFAEPLPDGIEKLSLLRAGRSRALVLWLRRSLTDDVTLRVVVREQDGSVKNSVEGVVKRLYDYLILTDGKFIGEEVLGRFVRHKRRRGLRVRLKNVDEILSGVETSEYADAIRDWLVREWERSRFVYLLIIGRAEPFDEVVDLKGFGLPFLFYPNRKSRFYLGNYPREKPVVELRGAGRTYFLSREDTLADSDGETAFLYINGAEAGEAVLSLYRRDGDVLRRVKEFSPFRFSKGFNEVRLARFGVRRGDVAALHLKSGALHAVPTEGVLGCRSVEGTPVTVRLADTEQLDVLPSFQVECFRVPETRCGTIPMKNLYPLGTYNAFGRAYFFDTHFYDCPSDYYYAVLKDVWDRDGDGYAGEALDLLAHFDEKTGFLKVGSGDGAIPLPDISVGRIPFDTEKEADKIKMVLERVMEREMAGSGRKEVLVAVEALAPDTLLKGLPDFVNRSLPEDGSLHTLFVEGVFNGDEARHPGGYSSLVRIEDVKEDVFAAAERLVSLWGRLKPAFVFLISHGNCDRLGNILPLRRLDRKHSIEPPFLKYVNRLPSDAPSVVLITGCNAAQPERNYLGFRRSSKGIRHNWEERAVVAEKLLERSALAVLSPTRSSWFIHNWKELSDGGIVTLLLLTLKELLKGVPAGLAYQDAVKRYVSFCGSRFTDAANIIGIVLYGDPSFSPINGGVTVITSELPKGEVGKPYSYALEGVGGERPYSWSLLKGFLPDGLTLSDTGVIEGLPKKSGLFPITLSLSDKKGRKSGRDLLLRIEPPLPDIKVKDGDVFISNKRGGVGYTMASAKLEPSRLFRLDTEVGVWRLNAFSLNNGKLVSNSDFSVRGSAEYLIPFLILSEDCEIVFDFECEMERGMSYALLEVRTENTDWKTLWFTTGDGRITPLGEKLRPHKRCVRLPLKDFTGRLLWLRFVYESNEAYCKRPKKGITFSNIYIKGLICPLRFEKMDVNGVKREENRLLDGDYILSISATGGEKKEYVFVVGR